MSATRATPPTVRATSLAQQADLTDAELRAGDDITLDPQPKDWADVRGQWDSTCTHFNNTDIHALWAAWLDDDTGAL